MSTKTLLNPDDIRDYLETVTSIYDRIYIANVNANETSF